MVNVAQGSFVFVGLPPRCAPSVCNRGVQPPRQEHAGLGRGQLAESVGRTRSISPALLAAPHPRGAMGGCLSPSRGNAGPVS